MENPHLAEGNTSSNGGFSIAMLDYRRVHDLLVRFQPFRTHMIGWNGIFTYMIALNVW